MAMEQGMKSGDSSSLSDAEKSLRFIEDGIRMLSLDYKEDPISTIDVLMLAVDAAEPEGVDMDEYRLRLADLMGVVDQRAKLLRLSLNRQEQMRWLREMLATAEAVEEMDWIYFHALEKEFTRLATIPFSRHRKDETGESNATPSSSSSSSSPSPPSHG